MINQVNVGATDIGANTTQTSAASNGTSVNGPSPSKVDTASTEVKPSVIVELSSGEKAAPVTYSFGNGPGKPPPTQSIAPSEETVDNTATAAETYEFGGGGVKRPPP